MKKNRRPAIRNNKTFNSRLMIMLICAAMVTVGIVLLFFSLFAIYKVYEIDMSIKVANRSAFDIDTDSINFGTAMPGNSNSRTIVITHDHTKPLLVHFKKSGNISRFIQVPDDFYLEPGLSKEISIDAIIPSDTEMDTYGGKLTVYFRRV